MRKTSIYGHANFVNCKHCNAIVVKEIDISIYYLNLCVTWAHLYYAPCILFLVGTERLERKVVPEKLTERLNISHGPPKRIDLSIIL